ncbi:uncharacterized protein JCM10292_001382 [Rhodotorula paludigena]|uniref:uncharacterized protein n=1 Tax=Rhodotorula paludigena TaxID=86838 RepID=UPI00316C8944
MLTSTLLAVATAAFALSAPSGGKGAFLLCYDDYGYGGDGLISVGNFNEKAAKAAVTLKEICYRNLYADVQDFAVKSNKEVLTKDSKNLDVFLRDGLKKDVNDQEFYYEEFCYKQFGVKEHNSKVSADSVLVGLKERDLGGLGGGLGSYGGLGGNGFDSYGGGLGGNGFDSLSFNRGGFLGGYNDFDDGLGGLGYGSLGGLGGGIGGVGVGSSSFSGVGGGLGGIYKA